MQTKLFVSHMWEVGLVLLYICCLFLLEVLQEFGRIVWNLIYNNYDNYLNYDNDDSDFYILPIKLKITLGQKNLVILINLVSACSGIKNQRFLYQCGSFPWSICRFLLLPTNIFEKKNWLHYLFFFFFCNLA